MYITPNLFYNNESNKLCPDEFLPAIEENLDLELEHGRSLVTGDDVPPGELEHGLTANNIAKTMRNLVEITPAALVSCQNFFSYYSYVGIE